MDKKFKWVEYHKDMIDALTARHEETKRQPPTCRGPGIGAVVAMVAAARMVRGGWYGVLRRSTSPVTHWDFAPAWMTNNALPACGDYWVFDHGIASGIDDVDCPDCLSMARRAGVLKQVTT